MDNYNYKTIKSKQLYYIYKQLYTSFIYSYYYFIFFLLYIISYYSYRIIYCNNTCTSLYFLLCIYIVNK